MSAKQKGMMALAAFPLAGLTCGCVTLSVNGNGDLDLSSGGCTQTAQAVLKACGLSAEEDFWNAIGNCANFSDLTDRQTCAEDMKTALGDATNECTVQFDARQAVCDRMGPAPYDPVIDPSNFVTVIDNPYFPLTPGTTFIYEGQRTQGFEHVEFFVTHNTKVILGVTCVEARDTVKVNGELTEDTLDWFAQDTDGNVWYFGENTHELVGGLITTIDGTFTGGVESAKPGIVMEAHPAIGDFYHQEFDLGNAEDFAEVVNLTESVTVPAGTYGQCLKTQETSPLEPDLLEYKFYAPGVGNVLTVDANTGEKSELVQITRE